MTFLTKARQFHWGKQQDYILFWRRIFKKCICKTGCKTSHCHCKKVSTKCSSQCHKGLKSKNYDKEGLYDKKKRSLPKLGGSFDFSKVKCVFVNTFPVHNWLVLFCSLSYENPEVYQNFIRKNLGTSSDFMAVLRLAQKCQLEMAKYKLVILTCKKEQLIFMETSTHYLQNI